jgi:hypothetical protein
MPIRAWVAFMRPVALLVDEPAGENPVSLPYLLRTVSTGQGDVEITRKATLPSRSRENRRRPRVPMTIRSVLLARAARTIRSAGQPSTIVEAVFTPATRAFLTSLSISLRARASRGR